MDLESGARGFVITGEERFLGPWNAARRAMPGESMRLVGLTDDAEQRRRAEGIARAVTSYLEDYSIPLVDAARRGDPFASSVARQLSPESGDSTRSATASTASWRRSARSCRAP